MTRQSVKQWFINHKPSKRRLIQIYAALLYNANIKGFISGNIYTSATTKYMCVPGLNCYSCPGAVGACPLGAFQNALAESGTRAPYYILGILGIFGLMLARTICGFLCPIGLCQEVLYKIRTPKLKKSRVTRVLSFLKYVILALAIALPLIYALRDVPLPAFCKYICPAGTFGGAIMLLINPSNASLFGQLGPQFTWKFSLLIFFIVASVFIYRFFCRFFCPLGAIYGFFNRFALIGVRVDKNDCTDCGLCVQHCKMDIKRVGDHECINCGECISVCPTKAISWKGSQIFLHKDAIAEVAPTVAPLKIENGTVAIPSSDITFDATAQQTGDMSYNSDTAYETAQIDDATPSESEKTTPVYYNAEDMIDKFDPAQAAASTKKAKKPAKFWIEMTAWILAVCLLFVALICYNFVDVDKRVPAVDTGSAVGDTAPDFTLSEFGTDNQINLYSLRGKVTVINFWATWCTPCVNEMPYFIELAEKHTDINVIAIHGQVTRAVDPFITNKGWDRNHVRFVQGEMADDKTTCLTYQAFGGMGTWPTTVIVDENGIVLYNSPQSFHSYEDLETKVLAAIN
ncbi:MAG: redoxin domain-containing protein [Clostridia bacterium]|nr:redoxin domain-containing protein [Clostridia bacterium]